MDPQQQETQRLLEQLGASIAAHMTPRTPLNVTPWDVKTCAAYLRVEPKTFLQSYAPMPTFPRAIRPATASGSGNPKWIAQEVIDWFLSQRANVEKRRKSRRAS